MAKKNVKVCWMETNSVNEKPKLDDIILNDFTLNAREKSSKCRGINLQHDSRSAIKGFYGSCSLDFIKPFFLHRCPPKSQYASRLPHRHNTKVNNVILEHTILRSDPSRV